MGIFKNTNIFGKYVSPLTGSDLNIGTRDFPYQSINKGLSVSPYLLLNGMVTENLSIGAWATCSITGDNDASVINGNIIINKYQDGNQFFSKLKIKYIAGCSLDCSFSKISSLYTLDGYNPQLLTIKNCFITMFSASILGHQTLNVGNLIIVDFINELSTYIYNNISNSIFTNSIDLYNYYSRNSIANIPIFKYCLFRASTVWKWNGAIIPINYGTYGNAAGDYLADVISAMHAYTNTIAAGTDRTYFSAMFPNAIASPIFYVDQNGQTCKVVEDRPSVAGSKKIFNRYIGDNPVDYSLFLHAENVALIMSDELSYVGCYKANADVLTFGDVMSVNEDGSDDLVTPPDMLIYDGNGKFRVSIADSVQIRNRVRSSVFHFKRGFTLDGFQSQMKSGLASRFSLGKFQPYNITDAPTIPQESIEVIPYDDAVTPSAFPRFSAMFNDKVQMWYHTAGAKKDLPVLFNDLLADFAIVTDKSLAEYGAWAVTNADYETFELSAKANVKLQNIPVYFAQVEINLNYHV